MIQQQIFTVLSGNEAVTDIVGTRIYPLRIPQRGSLPAVVYQIITTDPVNSLDGDSGLDLLRLQIKTWADKYEDAQALAVAVRNALNGAGSFKIRTVFKEDDQDPETLSYCVIAQYSVWSQFDVSWSPFEGDSTPIVEMEAYEFDGDGETKEFSFPSTFRSGSLLLFKNGVLTKDYSELTGRTGVSFTTAPAGGDYKDEFFAYYAKV